MTCGPVENIDDGFGLDDDDYYYYDDYNYDEEAVEGEGVDGNVEETVETANQTESYNVTNRRRRAVDDGGDPAAIWTTESPGKKEHHEEKGSGSGRRRRKPIHRTNIKFNWVFRNTSRCVILCLNWFTSSSKF